MDDVDGLPRTDGHPPADENPRGDEEPQTDDVTGLLAAWRGGDAEGLERLVEILYEHMRRQARFQRRRLPVGDTLATTALVHEAYLKLLRHHGSVADRHHFFAVAATAMRQILVDHARAKIARKRGGSADRISLESVEWKTTADGNPVEAQAISLLGLHRALDELATISPRLAKVVEYRFFGGMTEDQIAAVLGITDRTVRRDWIKAKALLYERLDVRSG